MLPLQDAQRHVLDSVEPLPVVTLGVEEAHGLALSVDVFAPHDVPPFANSGMDGFAVRSDDVALGPVELDVIEDVPAGSVAGRRVVAGTAIRIMTGAPMPAGADTVVPVEDTEIEGDRVRLLAGRPPGANVRAAGGDVKAGDLVLSAGERLDATRIAVLATVGVSPQVRRRPTVAVFSTGDELRAPDTAELEPGTIRDSNRPLLASLLTEMGCDIDDLGIVPDDEETLRSVLEGAAAGADVIVSSGGVSMGEYDLVKKVLDDLGSVGFWRVAMKPGKPFAFGEVGGRPFFGLPGNPVSVFVAYEQFVRPALLTMMGAARIFRPRQRGRAGEPISGDPERLTFARARLGVDDGGNTLVTLAGGQGSNMLAALSRADAFAVVPPGFTVDTGDEVDLEMFRWPEGRTRAEALG